MDWIGAFLIGVVTLPYQWWLMIRQRWHDRNGSGHSNDGDTREP